MRIRHDVTFVSCVLFTIALVCFIPPSFDWALGGYGDMRGLDTAWRALARSDSNIGKLELTLIIIGLIVTWTGYLNKVRWTWFVMFILVSGLVFPLGILPIVMHPKWLLDAPELLVEAWKGSQSAAARGILEALLIFSLMVIALFLPVKSFFSRRTGSAMGSHL